MNDSMTTHVCYPRFYSLQVAVLEILDTEMQVKVKVKEMANTKKKRTAYETQRKTVFA